MDIHIDIRWIHIEIDKVRYLHAHRYQALKGAAYRLMEISMLHKTTIHEEIVVRSLLSCIFRFTHKARNTTQSRFHFNRQQFLNTLSAKNIRDTLFETARFQVHQFLTITIEHESDLRIHQYDAFKSSQDIIQFCGIRLQELSASWHIKEKVFHLEVAPHRTCDRFLTNHLRTLQRQMNTYIVARHTRNQLNLRHRSDRRQCLTSESHGMEREEIVCLTNLRSSMTFEGQSCIRLRHTATVVYHLDRRATSINHQHLDVLRASIDSVLHQFLNDRSRTLNHLASSNLVGYGIRQ